VCNRRAPTRAHGARFALRRVYRVRRMRSHDSGARSLRLSIAARVVCCSTCRRHVRNATRVNAKRGVFSASARCSQALRSRCAACGVSPGARHLLRPPSL
jgi:hypothetical protein